MTEPVRRLAGAVFLAFLVLGLFSPALDNDFITLDDDQYVTANRALLDKDFPAVARWAVTSAGYASNWHPLTWLSHYLDLQLFGAVPRWHHLGNVLAHALSMGLLAVLLASLTGRRLPGLLAAALVAVHPQRVESVAWVAERKDVLAVFFLMLTLLAWTRYLRSQKRGHDPISGTSELGIVSPRTGSTAHAPDSLNSLGHDPHFHETGNKVMSRNCRGIGGGAAGGPPWSEPLVSATGVGRDGTPRRTNLSLNSQGHDPHFHEAGNKVMSRNCRGIGSCPGIPYYVLSLALYALGLMAKPSLVALPLALLLLDWWPLGRVGVVRRGDRPLPWRLLLEKAPFALLAAGSVAMTLTAQRVSGAMDVMPVSPGNRLANALTSLVCYLGQAVWPWELAVFYPHPREGIPAWQILGALALLTAATALLLGRRRSTPAAAFGAGWFLLWLLPVLGLVQVGGQARADRYSYLPSVGLAVAVAWGIGQLASRRPALRLPARAAALAALTFFALVTVRDIGYWRDSRTLYARALAVTRGNWLMNNNLGEVLGREGDDGAARALFQEAVRIRPTYPTANYNLGIALSRLGDLPAAERHLREAIRLRPRFARAYSALGEVLLSEGRAAEAVPLLEWGTRFFPGDGRLKVLLERARRSGGPPVP